MRYIDRLLSCHRINNKKCLMYGHTVFDASQLIHQKIIYLESSGCIDDHYIVIILISLYECL